MRQKSNRVSTYDSSTRRSSAPSIVSTSKPNEDVLTSNSIQNKSVDVLSILNPFIQQITDQLSRIEKDMNDQLGNKMLSNSQPVTVVESGKIDNGSNHDVLNRILEHTIDLHAKFDTRMINNKHNSDSNSEISLKLDSLHQKMDTIVPVRKSNAPNRSSIAFNTPLNTQAKSSLLDWSLNANCSPGSSSHADSSDLFTLLSSFERNTWTSLDYIREKIIENNNVTTNIQSSIDSLVESSHSNNSVSNSTHSPSHSPLLNSIAMETIHDIGDKCENIELKCIHIDQKVNSLIENQSTNINTNGNGDMIIGRNPIGMGSTSSYVHSSAGGPESDLSKQLSMVATRVNDSEQKVGGNPVGMGNVYSSANGPESDSTTQLIIETTNVIDGVHGVGGNPVGMGRAIQNVRSSAGGPETDPSSSLSITRPLVSEPEFSKEIVNLEQTEYINDSILIDEIANNFGFPTQMSNSLNQNQNSNAGHSNQSHRSRNNTHMKASKSKTRFNREFHITKFSPNVTKENVMSYISSKLKITPDKINVIRLTKKNQDLSQLSYVNFKIETCDEIAEFIIQNNFWPSYCKITPFTRKDVCDLNKLSTEEDNISSPNFLNN